MENGISSIRRNLRMTNRSKDVKKQAMLFGNITLGKEFIDDELVKFFIDILTNPKFFNKAGMDEFVYMFLLDIDKLTNEQKIKIFHAIERNYHKYKLEDFCWIIADFMARNLQESECLAILDKLSKTSVFIAGKRGVALALTILRKSSSCKDIDSRINDILSNMENKTQVQEGKLSLPNAAEQHRFKPNFQ